MHGRWRGRPLLAGTAILALLASLPFLVNAAVGRDDAVLTVRDEDGAVLERVRLTDATFALRYRNSLYRSTAEELYEVDSDGRIVLVGIGADELAVLEEYYAIDDPAMHDGRSRLAWKAPPAREVVLDELTLAATDLGRRTLLVSGQPPIELWRLVDDTRPSVTLEVDGR